MNVRVNGPRLLCRAEPNEEAEMGQKSILALCVMAPVAALSPKMEEQRKL